MVAVSGIRGVSVLSIAAVEKGRVSVVKAVDLRWISSAKLWWVSALILHLH